MGRHSWSAGRAGGRRQEALPVKITIVLRPQL